MDVTPSDTDALVKRLPSPEDPVKVPVKVPVDKNVAVIGSTSVVVTVDVNEVPPTTEEIVVRTVLSTTEMPVDSMVLVVKGCWVVMGMSDTKVVTLTRTELEVVTSPLILTSDDEPELEPLSLVLDEDELRVDV